MPLPCRSLADWAAFLGVLEQRPALDFAPVLVRAAQVRAGAAAPALGELYSCTIPSSVAVFTSYAPPIAMWLYLLSVCTTASRAAEFMRHL